MKKGLSKVRDCENCDINYRAVYGGNILGEFLAIFNKYPKEVWVEITASGYSYKHMH